MLDAMYFKLIPAFENLSDCYFTIFSNSSKDLNFFFYNKAIPFLKQIVNTINLANNEMIFPIHRESACIGELEAQKLFLITEKFVKPWQLIKRFHLKQTKNLFYNLIKEVGPVLATRQSLETKEELILKAINYELKNLSFENLLEIQHEIKARKNVTQIAELEVKTEI